MCGRTIRPTAEGILAGIEAFEAEDLPRQQRSAARTAYETFHSTGKYLEQYHRLIDATWERKGLPRSRDLSEFPAMPREPAGSGSVAGAGRAVGNAR